MPGEEDFGITMVESLASGKPIIGLGRGGAAEIATEGCGFLYPHQTEECLEDALQAFDRVGGLIHPAHLTRRAQVFSEAAFEHRFREELARFSISTSQTKQTVEAPMEVGSYA
jgi:glycosyltransferase involved in cell wall biosynthesis